MPTRIDHENHPYVPAGPDDSRSPCPALNALANHGYLPHDGRDLTHSQLVSALRGVYNLSYPLATLLTVGGIVLCGHWTKTLTRKLDLHGLAAHNVIEHDASLVHDDAAEADAKFAPTPVDRTLLARLLAQAATGEVEAGAEGALRLEDLCRAQVIRQGEARALDGLHAFIAKGELGLIFEALGVNEGQGEGAAGGAAGKKGAGEADSGNVVVPKRFLEQWLGDERLPDGWEGPRAQISQTGLSARVKEIGKLEDAIKESSADAKSNT